MSIIREQMVQEMNSEAPKTAQHVLIEDEDGFLKRIPVTQHQSAPATEMSEQQRAEHKQQVKDRIKSLIFG